MLIGELALKSGLSKDTIRFYEKSGLIQIDKKERRFNNYKEYSNEILLKLIKIKKLKNYGFTLNEVSHLMELIELNLADCNIISQLVIKKVAGIDEKIRGLVSLKNLLVNGIENCKESNLINNKPNCSILASEEHS